ncbi:Halomucin [Balamuthia mandrillaris]
MEDPSATPATTPGASEEEGPLVQLPLELLSHIFSFVETSQLYPQCFLVCRKVLAVLQDDVFWKERCQRDLGIDALLEPSTTWLDNYQHNLYMWDPEHATVSMSAQANYAGHPGRSVATNVVREGENRNFIIDGSVALWEGSGYVSVRSKRSFKGGIHRVAFKILSYNNGSHVWSVGLVDKNWDCRPHSFATSQRRSWCWGCSPKCSHSVTGLQADSKRSSKKFLPGWEKGAILQFVVNFHRDKSKYPDARTIKLYKQDICYETVEMPDDLEELWAVSLYGKGDSVQLVPSYSVSWDQLNSRTCETDDSTELSLWDPEHSTLTKEERQRLMKQDHDTGRCVAQEVVKSGPNQNFFIKGNIVEWLGQALRCDFNVLQKTGEHIFGVGLVDKNWDCRIHDFVGERRSWCWCSRQRSSHSVTGLHKDSQYPEKKSLPGWTKGDKLQFVVDFNKKKRSIKLYKNKKACGTMSMPSDLNELWAVVSLYGPGDKVQLSVKRKGKLKKGHHAQSTNPSTGSSESHNNNNNSNHHDEKEKDKDKEKEKKSSKKKHSKE